VENGLASIWDISITHENVSQNHSRIEQLESNNRTIGIEE
jgi:hypothetical protein